jgi:branched-chain amino acid aminotransferase
VHPEQLQAAAEVFLTGTTAGVWPVGAIDGKTVGDGEAGPVSLRLRERFFRIAAGEDPDFLHWLTPANEGR